MTVRTQTLVVVVGTVVNIPAVWFVSLMRVKVLLVSLFITRDSSSDFSGLTVELKLSFC